MRAYRFLVDVAVERWAPGTHRSKSRLVAALSLAVGIA